MGTKNLQDFIEQLQAPVLAGCGSGGVTHYAAIVMWAMTIIMAITKDIQGSCWL